MPWGSTKSHWINYGPKCIIVVVWLGVNALLFWRTYSYFKYDIQFFYLHQILGVGLCISRGTATVINLNLGALLLPMCRTITTVLRGRRLTPSTIRSTLDHCKGFHILCAGLVVGASVTHCFAHVINAKNYSDNYNGVFTEVNAASRAHENPLLIVLCSMPGVTGIAMVLLLSVIFSASVAYVRVSSYDIFVVTHRLVALLYVLVLAHGVRGILKAQKNIDKHTPGCVYQNYSFLSPAAEAEYAMDSVEPQACTEYPEFHTIGCASWMWVGLPMLVYVCDSLYRIATRSRTRAFIRGTALHCSDIMEIHVFRDGFKALPGQYVLLNFPKISKYEFHPYTISKCPSVSDPTFSVHIKTAGDWSGRLRGYFSGDNGSDSSSEDVLICDNRLLLEGPFGSPMCDVMRYHVTVCVAGGIGITAYLAHMHKMLECSLPRKLRRFHLLWICRSISTLRTFAAVLQNVHTHFWHANFPDGFWCQCYITGDTSQEELDASLLEFPYLLRRTRVGRPDLSRLLHSILEPFDGVRIGIFTCGPKPLTEAMEKATRTLRLTSSVLHHHHESF